MGFIGSTLKFLGKRTLEASILFLLVVYIPGIPPESNISKSYKVTPPKPFEGKLALNNKLSSAQMLHHGEILGPESLAEFNGEIYTGLLTGEIVKLKGKHITPVAKIGKPCKGVQQEHICGRPLGIRFHHNGDLYAADAYYGIYKVDINTGDTKQIISVDEEINGVKPKVPNGITIACNGDIYWSDSSTNFGLVDGLFDILSDGTGRLIHYDVKTKKNKVLIEGLVFANGVELSDDEEFVIVSDTGRNLIARYHLKGEKKGTEDIFIDGLPGSPDNLQSDGHGGFLVPLVFSDDDEHPGPIRVLSQFPLVRRFFSRLLGMLELVFIVANHIYNHEIFEHAIHFVGHFDPAIILSPKRSTVLHLSKEGEILNSIHSLTNRRIRGHCEGLIIKDELYLASPFNDYLVSVPLKDLGWDHLKNDRPLYLNKKALCFPSLPSSSSEKVQVKTEKLQDTPKVTKTVPQTAQKSTTTPSPKVEQKSTGKKESKSSNSANVGTEKVASKNVESQPTKRPTSSETTAKPVKSNNK